MRVFCRDCGVKLTPENNSSGFKALCKSCYAIYMKEYYKNKPEKYKTHKEKYVKLNDELWKLKTHALMAERFVSGCMDCGERNPVVLDFDHRNPSEKSFGFGSDKKTKRSVEEFIAELDKCDVVCANCHRIRTANMFGSWRLNLPPLDKI